MSAQLDRLGADFLVAPRDATVNLTAALLTVEPTTQTLDARTVEQITQLAGVDVAAPQRYFAIPAGDSAHGDLDIIAFDPSRDFTVRPWLVEKLDRPMGRDDVIVGGRRPESVGTSLPVLQRTLTVYGKLGLTGVGPFERSLFMSFETAQDLLLNSDAEAGRATGVLVRLKPAAASEQFRFAAARLSDAQVVMGNGIQTAVRQNLTLILGSLTLLSAFALAAAALTVAGLYTGLLAERRREIGLLRSIGLRARDWVRVVLIEASLAAAMGGAAGALVGAGLLAIVRRSVGYWFEIKEVPFHSPSSAALVWLATTSVALCGMMGAIGAVLPARRTAKAEIYELVRGEGAG